MISLQHHTTCKLKWKWSPLFIVQSKKCNNYTILYLFTNTLALLWIIERKKWIRKIKKMCRARGKSRAREDQNHIIFFTSPYMRFYKHFIYFRFKGFDRKICTAIFSDDVIIETSNVIDRYFFKNHLQGRD